MKPCRKCGAATALADPTGPICVRCHNAKATPKKARP